MKSIKIENEVPEVIDRTDCRKMHSEEGRFMGFIWSDAYGLVWRGVLSNHMRRVHNGVRRNFWNEER